VEAFLLGSVLSALYLRYRWDADPGWAKRIYGSELRTWRRTAVWGLVVGFGLAVVTYLAPGR